MCQDRKLVIPGISQQHERSVFQPRQSIYSSFHHQPDLSPHHLQAHRASPLQVYVLCKKQFLSGESPHQLDMTTTIYTGQCAHTSPTEAAGGVVAGVFQERLPSPLTSGFILMFCSESHRASHCCPQHSRVKCLSVRHSGPSNLLPQIIPTPFPHLRNKHLVFWL